MDLVKLARHIVETNFPNAQAAFLAGSASEGKANKFSDLDIVIILEGPPAPYRETIRAEGWPVELFIHTNESITYWNQIERQSDGCTLSNMLATGIPLMGPKVDEVSAQARAYIKAGPEPWTAARLEHRRYLVSDLLEDLAGARDDDERDIVAGLLLTMTSELVLTLAGSWQGKGKWLLRRLRECDSELAHRLLSGHRDVITTGDTSNLIAACETVLAPLGGRLSEGFTVR